MDEEYAALLQDVLDDVPLAFLDVETTGLSPAWGHRVCEIAVLRCQGSEALAAMQHLVYPQRPMDPRAFQVHHISDEMLLGKPLFGEVLDELREITSGAVLVGHNTPFDLGFLHAEMARVGAGTLPNLALDTLRLARAVYRARRYALDALVAALNLEVGGEAHRALGDVLRTRALLTRLIEDLWPEGVRTLAHFLQLQGDTPAGPGQTAGPRSLAPGLEVPPLIVEALEGHHLLRLRYEAVDGQVTERTVRPIDVVERGGNISLIAHCYLRDALRDFRLDRILEIELIRE